MYFSDFYSMTDDEQQIEIIDKSKGHPPIFEGEIGDAPMRYSWRKIDKINSCINFDNEHCLSIVLEGIIDDRRLDKTTQENTGNKALGE